MRGRHRCLTCVSRSLTFPFKPSPARDPRRRTCSEAAEYAPITVRETKVPDLRLSKRIHPPSTSHPPNPHHATMTNNACGDSLSSPEHSCLRTALVCESILYQCPLTPCTTAPRRLTGVAQISNMGASSTMLRHLTVRFSRYLDLDNTSSHIRAGGPGDDAFHIHTARWHSDCLCWLRTDRTHCTHRTALTALTAFTVAAKATSLS
jgi:hypothetical protein